MNRIVTFVDQAADGHDNDPEPSSVPDQSPAQGSLRHLLRGRDQCSDALGAGTTNSICAPSNTLCSKSFLFSLPRHHTRSRIPVLSASPRKRLVLRRKVSKPNVQKRWWIRNGVPLGAACDEANSVLCTNLSPGAQQVCCPPLTSCAGQQEKSKVRCQIVYQNLMAVADSGTPSSSSSKTPSSVTGSSTPTPTTASSTAATSSATPMINSGDGETAATTTQEQPSRAMRGGAIAGVTVGIVVFLLLAGVVTRYLLRRRQRSVRNEAATSANNGQDLAAALDNKNGTGIVGVAPGSHHWKHQGSEPHVAELYGDDGYEYGAPHEMDGTYQSR
ncbi:hypothetical protein PG984_005707 [Apiospora sp. TS-2023a]